jgi:hypothetical protein
MMGVAFGKSSTRVMPSVTSGRYSPGLGIAVSSKEGAVPLNTSLLSRGQPQKNSVTMLQSLKFSDLVGEIMRELPVDLEPLPQFKFYT